MTCHSGGTLEIYVEPNLPRAAPVGRRHHPDRGRARRAGHRGRASRSRCSTRSPTLGVSGGRARSGPIRTSSRSSVSASPYVVVATQGQWDEEALAGALRRDARYVGLVASPTRGRRRPRVAARGDGPRRRAARRAAGAGRHGPRRRDARGGRALDPRRARSRSAAAGPISWRRPDRRRSPGTRRSPGLVGAAGGVSLAAADDIVTTDPVCGHGSSTPRTPGTSPSTMAPSTRSARSAAGRGSSASRRSSSRPRRARTPWRLHEVPAARSRSTPRATASGPSSWIPTRSGRAGRASRRSRSSTRPTSRRRRR